MRAFWYVLVLSAWSKNGQRGLQWAKKTHRQKVTRTGSWKSGPASAETIRASIRRYNSKSNTQRIRAHRSCFWVQQPAETCRKECIWVSDKTVNCWIRVSVNLCGCKYGQTESQEKQCHGHLQLPCIQCLSGRIWTQTFCSGRTAHQRSSLPLPYWPQAWAYPQVGQWNSAPWQHISEWECRDVNSLVLSYMKAMSWWLSLWISMKSLEQPQLHPPGGWFIHVILKFFELWSIPLVYSPFV